MATHIWHQFPVWGERVDSEAKVEIPGDSGGIVEHLPTQRVSEDQLKICCVPAFAFDLSLGDVVKVNKRNRIVFVTVQSGRYVFRIWSDDGWLHKRNVLDEIAELNGLMETCSERLISIDVPNEKSARKLSNRLSEMEAEGLLYYETGRSGGNSGALSGTMPRRSSR